MKEGFIKESGNSALTAWQIFKTAQKQNGPVLYLLEDQDRQMEIWQNLLLFSKAVMKEKIIAHCGVDGKTLWLLKHNVKSAIIVTEEQACEPVVSPDEFRKRLQAVACGIKITPRKLASVLQSFGFISRAQSPERQEFKIQGGHMEINDSISEKIYHVEFDEEKIVDVTPNNLIAGPLTVKQGKASIWSYVNDNHLVLKEILFGPQTQIPKELKNLENLNGEQVKNLIIEFLQMDFNFIFAVKNESQARNLFDLLQISKWKNKINVVAPCPSSSKAFTDENEKFLFLTDKETALLLQEEQKGKKFKPGPSIKEKIKPGDYVVHIDHGVGIFKEISILKNDEIERDYFVIEYAQGDKLYVPVSLEEKLDLYIGAETPRLTRLSTSSWEETKKKVKEDLAQLVRELLSIYAKREISEAMPLKPRPEEAELNNSFNFELTLDQKNAIDQTLSGLESSEPSDRLICGDSGFGKTEIAVRAAFRTILNSAQVAFLCPTTILANQHYDTFANRLEGEGTSIALLSRAQNKKEQENILLKLKNGSIDIVIGTHRLLQKEVSFLNLGLVIIDEEQKFGVKQKEQLKKLRSGCHVISLSATPIPRTLNMALSGLKQINVISTPPQGRLSIDTYVGQYDEEILKQAVEREVKRGGQVFYLFNKVKTMDVKLKQIRNMFPDLRLRFAHGRMPQDELNEIMTDLNHGKIDLLVATTIIENGLDIPNVNTLIVEDSTRFGLSSLYQLRGRVGRSTKQSYAYFFYSRKKLKGKSFERLNSLERANKLGSGFSLALRDIEIRGVGSVLGKKQHGHMVSIGLNLYLRLLEEEIIKLKSNEDGGNSFVS